MSTLVRMGDHPLNEWLDSNVHFQYTFRAKDECKYVTDLVGNSWKQWEASKPIFISAQTGKGKNTFIEDILLKNCLTWNRTYQSPLKVLIVMNRTALRRQTIARLASIITKYTGDTHYQEKLNLYSDVGIDKYFHQLGNIFVVTYQYISTSEGGKLLQTNNFEYVILDEAHFFTTDALFNAHTEEILNNIVHLCNSAKRVYMSSTIETVFEPIVRAEYKEWNSRRPSAYSSNDALAPFTIQKQNIFLQQYRSLCIQSEQFTIRFYDFERDYTYLNELKGIDQIAMIDEILKNKNKWLIFVANKKHGDELKKQIEGKAKVVFLTSESKSTVAYNELIKNEFLDKDVIIATAVIDNGINIKDAEINNIAIEIFDRTEFMQMLGRVRLQSKQDIQLWIPSWNPEELNKLLILELRKLVDFLLLDELPSEEIESIKNIYLKYKDGFDMSQEKGLYYSHLALYPLLESIQRISRILRNNNPSFTIKSIEDEDEAKDNDKSDSPYYNRALKIFYDAVKGKLPMSDAISRTILGLNLMEDNSYLEEQIRWNLSEEKDDSFLYYLYEMRIKDLKDALQSRSLKEDDKNSNKDVDSHLAVKIEDIEKTIRRQEKFLTRFGQSSSALEEINYWLERKPPKKELITTISNENENIGELLQKFSVSEEKFYENVSKGDKICHNDDFLKTFGISKKVLEDGIKSPTNKMGNESSAKLSAFLAIHDYYQNNDGLDVSTATKLMNKTKNKEYQVDNLSFWIDSFHDTDKHTYYAVLYKNSE